MSLLSETKIVEVDRPQSGDAWSAIIGGAVAASAVSLILLVLGAGLGLGSLSPWSSLSANAAPIAVGAVIWIIVVQWIASALGGYLTGRMRTPAEPSDEVFFRDTANGFLAWAVATVVAAGLLASATSTVINATTRVAAGGVAAIAQGSASQPTDYFTDMLLRPLPGSHPDVTAVSGASSNMQPPAAAQGAPDLRSEVGRILTHGLTQPEFPPTDVSYLTDMVAARTGLAADAAKTRVDDVIGAVRDAITKTKSAADTARAQAAKLSIYLFLSLIVGAFIASAAAALAGLHRDDSAAKMRR